VHLILYKVDLPRSAAGFLKDRLDLSKEEEEVAAYSLEMIIYGGAGFLLVCVAGWLLKCLAVTLIVLIVGMLLRSFSGGAHSSSPYICILVSIMVVSIFGKLAVIAAPYFSYPALVLVVTCGFIVSLAAVWRLAPVESPKKPISSEKHRRHLRLLSMFFVFLAVAVQASLLLLNPLTQVAVIILAIEAGLLWQTFSITQAGHRFIATVDSIF
jgi:accessory gene regulator B